ncbi:hypothetical protein C2G38_2201256 [Gigaspora rosea]|uniref:Membrane anchor Opy2 N-terminal domain-containing protein n=1 Tax=Gigaspora rosea TaxID=44941 RepID=A0A397UQW7_9GLOM|nr:hypothetical protein C2G38_2201256 [Gigaspora rosea]
MNLSSYIALSHFILLNLNTEFGDYPYIECQNPPTECNQTCNNDEVCILTEMTCSKCPEWICQPKTNPKCNECPTPKCDNSTDYCEVQDNFCYNCGQAYHSSNLIVLE